MWRKTIHSTRWLWPRQAWCPIEFSSTALTQRGMRGVSNLSSNCLPGLHSAPGLSAHFWARAPALLPCFFSCCLLTPLALIAFMPPESNPHLPVLSSRPFFLLHPANPPCPSSASMHAPKPSLCPPTPGCKKFRDFRIVCAKGIFFVSDLLE